MGEWKHSQAMIQMNLQASNYRGTLIFHTTSGLGKAWDTVKTQMLDGFQVLLSHAPLLWFHYDP